MLIVPNCVKTVLNKCIACYFLCHLLLGLSDSEFAFWLHPQNSFFFIWRARQRRFTEIEKYNFPYMWRTLVCSIFIVLPLSFCGLCLPSSEDILSHPVLFLDCITCTNWNDIIPFRVCLVLKIFSCFSHLCCFKSLFFTEFEFKSFK